MNHHELDSKALRDAALRSDRIRIILILAVLGILTLLTAFRFLVFRLDNAGRSLAWLFTFCGAASIYESLMLLRVNRAIRSGSDLHPVVFVVNILIETLFPTLGMFLIIAMGMVNPYQALVAPVVLTYFIFVALSTLKLDPWLARLAGVFSAAGYGLVALGIHFFYPAPEIRSAMQPVD